MRRAHTAHSSHTRTAAALLNTIVGELLRALLAEDTQIVVELNGEVTTDDAVPRVLREARACGAGKR